MWLGVYLLYCVLQESSGCTVERGPGPTITGSVGDTVVLPCSCKSPGPVDPQTVQWGYRKKFKQGDYTAEHSVFPKDGSVNQRYRDRVERPTQNPPGQVSLIISPLTEEDEGAYVCGNHDYNRAVTLYVGGCSMVEPSHTLTRSPGESVLLPCPCPSTGHVKPERVTWSYSKAGSSDQTPVSNDTGSYRGRVWTFDQTGSRNLSLLISDLTKEDAGQYYCTSDKRMSSVYLRVKAGQAPGQQGDQTAELENWVIIIIFICAVLLIMLLLMGGVACIERKCIQGRKQRKDKDTGQRTNQADDDYENDPRNISMGPVYQSLNPKTNQSDSVYQSLNPKTNQSDSVYQSLNPKTNQSDSVYQSLDPKTNQSDSVYQSLDPRTNQSDSLYQSLDPRTNQSDSVYQSPNLSCVGRPLILHDSSQNSAHRLLLVDCSQSSSDTEVLRTPTALLYLIHTHQHNTH